MTVKRKILILILILTIISLIMPISAQDTTNTWYVSNSDTNGNGTENSPFNNIDSALESAKENNTIIITNGTYNKPVQNISTNGLTINGKNAIIKFNDNDSTINIYGENIKINGLIFANSKNTALTTYSNNLILENTSFIDNMGEYGGAIYNYGKLTINNSTFINNSAQYGGAIYNRINLTINNSIFNQNTGKQYGGTIYNQNILNIDNSKFIENTVNGYGGVIYNYRNATVLNSNFTNNSAIGFGYGGAIHNYGNLILINSKFNKNNAYYGGAIDTDNNLIMQSCEFTENTAIQSAGAIDNNGNLELTDTLFSSNSAGYHAHGGAIFNRGNLTINQNQFKNNTANSNGGAIYVDWGKLDTNNTNFTSNTAEYGGAIYIKNTEIYLSNSKFGENNANKGINIYTNNSTGSFIFNSINNNTICLENSDINITEYIFTSINVSNLSKTFHDDKNLSGKLIDDLNEGISGQHIEIKITRLSNGLSKTYDVVTDYTGEFNLPINLGSGNYLANIKYNEVNMYKSSKKDVKINITNNKNKTFILSSDFYEPVDVGESFKGYLKDVNNVSIQGQHIKVTLVRLSNNLNKTYDCVSDYNGLFSLPINLAKGNYMVYCSYEGINGYEDSNSINTLTIY